MLSSLQVNGEAANYRVQGQEIFVDMPEVTVNQEVELQVESVAAIGEGDGLGVHWDGETLFSFHEPQGARLWMVVYDDPDDKATLDWYLGVDSA